MVVLLKLPEELRLPKEELVSDYLEKLLKIGLTEEEIAVKLGVSQSTVSRFLKKGMGLSYDTVYKAVILIQEHQSPLPNEPIKNFHYPKAEEVTKIRSDKLLREAAFLMKQHGYTQIPVYRGYEILGIVTDFSILKRMTTPLKKYSKDKWLMAMSNLTVAQADVIERVPIFPDTASLTEVIEGLSYHYAVLITEESEDKIGIITRNDLAEIWLKLTGNL